ncbi:MAG: hypothetical protein KatS3mg062_1323 [Tepidiforma sp.]|nr:MAG: hypothetical protein KatS3mg062_1323 [Tepidiforma sp.]
MGYARPELLVEPDWLMDHLDDPAVRIIDCAALEAYRRAHIPGAVHLPVHYYIKEKGPPWGRARHLCHAAARVRSPHGSAGGYQRHARHPLR